MPLSKCGLNSNFVILNSQMAIQITETFYPKERTEWRKWLKENHNKKSEIWVVYYKKHTGKPTIAYYDAVDEALCFGWIDGVEKRIDDKKYAQRFTPRTKTSNWSEGNIKRYKLLFDEGLMDKAGEEAYKRRLQT